MKVLGAILCGGRSSRFGSDKALALLDGRPLIEHVRAALAEYVDGVIACGRAVDGVERVFDHPAADLGPLGGLNAALRAARGRGYDAVLSVACDTPRLPPDLRARLEAVAPAYLAAAPVIGLWPTALAPDLADFVANDARRSVRDWTRRIGAVALDLGDLPNVNRPGDLAALAR